MRLLIQKDAHPPYSIVIHKSYVPTLSPFLLSAYAIVLFVVLLQLLASFLHPHLKMMMLVVVVTVVVVVAVIDAAVVVTAVIDVGVVGVVVAAVAAVAALM
uniref:Transmembrane protein n=1 Tax=Ditylum brightwellii TaxID=49249 RepID=A0A7S1ZPT5_9STRA